MYFGVPWQAGRRGYSGPAPTISSDEREPSFINDENVVFVYYWPSDVRVCVWAQYDHRKRFDEFRILRLYTMRTIRLLAKNTRHYMSRAIQKPPPPPPAGR